MTKRRRTKSKWSAFARPDGSFDVEALTDAQKAQLYAECEALPDDHKSRPLTAAQRRLHARARRRGRPRKGRGSRIVSLSIEADLLRQAERLARARGISRSELFALGLRAVIDDVT